MKEFFIQILVYLIVISLFSAREKPKELIEKFKLRILKKGDGKTYPLPIASIQAHARYYSPPSMQVFDDTYKRNMTLILKLGRDRIMKCWEEILPYMSKGEKVFITCPWELAFGEGGAYPWVPPKTDVPFELESVHIDEDPEWHYKYNRERTPDEL